MSTSLSRFAGLTVVALVLTALFSAPSHAQYRYYAQPLGAMGAPPQGLPGMVGCGYPGVGAASVTTSYAYTLPRFGTRTVIVNTNIPGVGQYQSTTVVQPTRFGGVAVTNISNGPSGVPYPYSAPYVSPYYR